MRLFLITLLLTPFLSIAQITINASDIADGGDAVTMSTALDPTIDFSSTGANYTWDFSSLTNTGQELKTFNDLSNVSFLVDFMFGTFAGSDYKATNYVPSTALPLDQLGNFLPVNITDVFQYSKNSADSITSVGYAIAIDGTEVPFKSDTIETRYKFPMNFGDSYSSRGYSNLDMNPLYNGIWRQYRQRQSNVDGWGSITTPYGTFDALRIDHYIQETDSLYMDLFGTGMWIELPIPDSHVYEWWTTGKLEPVLRITTNVILGNETVSSIEYRDNLVNQLEELTFNVALYPNPCTNTIQVTGIETDFDCHILNTAGKRVFDGTLSADETKIDVSELPKGMYTLIVSIGKLTGQSSFIKK